jgi:hypothetical protein
MNMSDSDPRQEDQRENEDETQDVEPRPSAAADRAKEAERRMEESGQENPG